MGRLVTLHWDALFFLIKDKSTNYQKATVYMYSLESGCIVTVTGQNNE